VALRGQLEQRVLAEREQAVLGPLGVEEAEDRRPVRLEVGLFGKGAGPRAALGVGQARRLVSLQHHGARGRDHEHPDQDQRLHTPAIGRDGCLA